MTPERWQQVKEILHGALQKEPGARSVFLGQACQTDPSLQREVESLLASAPGVAEDFLKSAPPDRIWLVKGKRLGAYEIVDLIGAGGMGEVYRAHDPRLGRDVAVKILPHAFVNDPDRLHRFEQEARAAAGLNHPNILAIYDIGTADDSIPYVVSELLEGETLRECLRRGPLPVRKTVDLTLQITSGLAAAHEKGIIHRDLKPENLFLTKDGRVKILDFGLAKAIRGVASSPLDHRTLTAQTDAGLVMGTVGYMPPEQVRGQTVDQRSDIFAVGAIIYEMLLGKRAFHGDTTADTINAILSRDPAPLLEANPALSPAVERIVQRCLEKNPNERFHSVRDVAFSLEAISDLPSSPASGASGFSETRLWQKRSIRVLAVAAVVLCLGASLLYYRTTMGSHGTQEWEQLTSFADSVSAPALSPDGRMLAFVRNASTFIARGDVYVKMLPHGEPVQLTRDDNLKTNPVFSPDGSRIAYTTAPPWDTWVVPTLGGKAQVMLPNASGLTWIDEGHLLFSEIKSGVHMAVVTAAESRSEKRDIYVPAQQEGMAHRSSLSPDHKWVLVATEMDIIDLKPCRLVPFDGSSAGTIVGPPDGLCTFAGWSKNGKWMFFSATTGHGFHLWRQRFPDGKPEQFTFGPTEEEGIAVAPDGHSLLTAVGLSTGTVTVHNESGERPIPFEGQARLTTPQTSSRAIFSPDGTKIYFLGQRGVGEPEDLWVEDIASGLAERAVPGFSLSSSYDVSPDGKEIALDSRDPQGVSHIWLASVDHRQSPRQLESSYPQAFPVFGPKGELFYQSEEGGNSYLNRRNLQSGDSQRVIPGPIVRFRTISPDGRWVVAEVPQTGESVTRGVAAYRLADGTMKRVCRSLCIVTWTLDGKYIFISLFGGSDSSPEHKTFIVPLRHGESFPDLPAAGIEAERDLAQLSGVTVVSGLAYPGPDVAHYAFSRWTVQRNIYRIPIP